MGVDWDLMGISWNLSGLMEDSMEFHGISMVYAIPNSILLAFKSKKSITLGVLPRDILVYGRLCC